MAQSLGALLLGRPSQPAGGDKPAPGPYMALAVVVVSGVLLTGVLIGGLWLLAEAASLFARAFGAH